MFKKLLSIVLLIGICLFISCGGGGGSDENNNESATPYDPTGLWRITTVYQPSIECYGIDYDVNNPEIIQAKNELKNSFEELYKKSVIRVENVNNQLFLVIENSTENERYKLETRDRKTYRYSDKMTIKYYGYVFDILIDGRIIIDQNQNTGDGSVKFNIKVKDYNINCDLIIEYDAIKIDVLT